MYDAKYTTHLNIMSRLSRVHKHKEVNDIDIMEWCAECCIEYIQDSSYYVQHNVVKLDVHNNTVNVPCYLHRILDLYYDPKRPDSVVKYIHNGAWLHLEEGYSRDYVYINFWGLPISEQEQVPLILKGHEQACMAFCVQNLYYEDFLQGKIDGQRWGFIVEDFNAKLSTSRSGMKYIDNEDLREENMIQGNMITDITGRKPNHIK